jgi:hypothetical protein
LRWHLLFFWVITRNTDFGSCVFYVVFHTLQQNVT